MSGSVVVETAPAKLNLALHVRRRRADGYHDIETVFAFCGDGDVVTVAPAPADTFAVTGPFAGALAGESDNLVTRAATAFCAAFAIDRHHAITLKKNLPVASGIGGGSADAAATLRALARLHGVDYADLHDVAASLGADVPACLLACTAFGTGRGDALAPIAGWSGTPVLLVNPRAPVATAAVFARWDGKDRGPLDPADPLAGRNDLEAPARALAPAIGDVLTTLAAQPGVTLARMSGSGATCFALFGDADARDDAAGEIIAHSPGWWLLATTLT